jgi:putative acetyltransferase
MNWEAHNVPPSGRRVVVHHYEFWQIDILMSLMMEIRAEQPEDRDAVRQVNMTAFGRESEADLVDRLRDVESTVSLVAVDRDRVVGHILFSPVAIEGECQCEGSILGLAPLAVMPKAQRKGVGAMLIRQGLEVCVQMGVVAIVVLGAPRYYQRFGFRAAKEQGLRCEYEGSDESFMVLELVPDALKKCVGLVRYLPEFSMVE